MSASHCFFKRFKIPSLYYSYVDHLQIALMEDFASCRTRVPEELLGLDRDRDPVDNTSESKDLRLDCLSPILERLGEFF